jgi:putative membrane protein
MDPFGVRVVVSPPASAAALAFVLGGVALGTLSGLTPGLHVNTLALLLAAAAPAVPGPPHLVGAAMLAAGVVHSFLDVVPALALGVPDAAMAMTALPGHRLVIAGRGREALRLSALGSGGAVLVAVPLAIPLTAAMTELYPVVRAHLPLVLGGVVAFLVATESSRRGMLGGAVAVAASGALGVATLGLDPAALVDAGGMLSPLFAGLFGAPVLLDALDGGGVPPQDDAAIAAPPREVGLATAAGAAAGAVVGYVPGVSGAIAAILALVALPSDAGDRSFVVATSGVNTANTIFALVALVALGTPRTGVMVAFENASVPLNLPLLLASAALASVVGFVLVLVVGDRYLHAVGNVDYRLLSGSVLAMLAVLAGVFAGWVGVPVFGVSTAIGMIPVRFGARRVHLMGVLIVPIMAGV